jgi:hypothetical protein
MRLFTSHVIAVVAVAAVVASWERLSDVYGVAPIQTVVGIASWFAVALFSVARLVVVSTTQKTDTGTYSETGNPSHYVA